MNEDLIKTVLHESAQIQLSKRVAETLNEEPPINSKSVNSLISSRMKKQNQKIKELEKALKDLTVDKTMPLRPIIPPPILRNNFKNKKKFQTNVNNKTNKRKNNQTPKNF